MKQHDRRKKPKSISAQLPATGPDYDSRFTRFLSPGRKDIAGITIAGICLFVLFLVLNRGSVQYLTSPSTDEIVLTTEELDQGIIKTTATVVGRPLKTSYGFATAPGAPWSITWRAKTSNSAVPLVRLHAFHHPHIRNEIVFGKGDVYTTVPLQSNHQGTLIVPESLASDISDFSVSFVSTPLPQLIEPQFVLDRIVVGSKAYPKGELSPHFYQVFYLALLPAIVFLVLSFFLTSRFHVLAASVAALVAGIILAEAAPFLFSILYWGFCGLAVLLLLIAYYRHNEKPVSLGAPEIICALAIATILLPLRWNLLLSTLNVPLPPDAADYMQIAEAMSHPLDTRYREPGFIWLMRLWFALTAWTPACMRLFTVILSVAGGLMTWKVARLFVSPMVSLILMLFFMFNPALLGSSVQGLREEVFPLALLGYVYCGVMLARTSDRKWFIAVAILTGIVPLIRLSGLPFVVITTAIIFWYAKATVRQWAMAVTILILAVVPFAIYQANKYGDPFHSSNTYVGTFYKNMEFGGQPGYPTVEEIAKNPWSGEQVGMSQYMLGMHSPTDAAAKITSGSISLLAGKTARNDLLRLDPKVSINYQGRIQLPDEKPHFHETALYLLYLAGMVALCFQPQGWILLLCILGIQGPLSFLEGSNLIGWRLTMNVIPLMLIAAGIGISTIISLSRRMTKSDEAPRRETKLKRR